MFDEGGVRKLEARIVIRVWVRVRIMVRVKVGVSVGGQPFAFAPHEGAHGHDRHGLNLKGTGLCRRR